MSYNVTITGHVTATDQAEAQAVEQTITDGLRAALAALPDTAGLTSADGSFEQLGAVDLLPAPPAPSLADAVAELAAAVQAAPTPDEHDGSVLLTGEEWAAITKAAGDVETAEAAPAETAETDTAAPATHSVAL